jgi:phosphate transport system substrate-binding protein
MRRTNYHLLFTTVLLGCATCTGCSGCGGGGQRLDGAGSSFVDPMMQEWASIYEKDKGVKINYQSRGSGAGIDMMTGQEVDFGCSDSPLNDNQLAKAKAKNGDVIHVPLCMGAIVPIYNVPGDPELHFTGEVLADIYLGNVKKWNDPEIVKLNPGAKLPDLEIAVVRRSDSSGSTFIWTDYFTKVSKKWDKGASTAVEWPVGVGQKGNDNVAGHVKRTEGAIGYVELIYALKNDIKFGTVKNQTGKDIKADTKSVTAAAAGFADKIPDDLRYSLTNAPGEDSYPISGTVWAILYVKQPPDKGKKLKDFLTWATHEGQKETAKLHYAALPEELVKKVEGKLALIETGK